MDPFDNQDLKSTQPRPSALETDANGIPLPFTGTSDIPRPNNNARETTDDNNIPSHVRDQMPRHNPAHPLPPTSRGDFSGDLTGPAAGGGGGGGDDDHDDGSTRGMARPSGNQMGPDHPMFQHGVDVGANPRGDVASGFGMHPRFDPVGPPGGPQQVTNPSGTFGRRTVGEPNPDHLQPPNSLGNNGSMF